MLTSSEFFKLPLFAVVGASNNRGKFGNKVLRAYLYNDKKAVPVNPNEDAIEGLKCVGSLTVLKEQLSSQQMNVKDVGVSIITPPSVTRAVLQEGVSLGLRNFFLQPGTVDHDVQIYINEITSSPNNINVIQGCVLVEI